MKSLAFLAAALISAPAFANSSLYINIGDCAVEGRPEASFRVMLDTLSAEESKLARGLLIFKEVEDPELPNETLTLAISTILEKQADGSYQFENLIASAPGQKILLKSGAKTKTTFGEITFLCKGKNF